MSDTRVIHDILTAEEIQRIHNLPVVTRERSGRFMVELPMDIHDKLSDAFGIPLARLVPFRWVRGDTPVHTDLAWDHRSFENTYLVYLSDSTGVIQIDEIQYPIRAGDGFCFQEHLPHSTAGTSPIEDRLLLGPMNERSVPVGYAGVYYFNDEGAYFNQGEFSGILLTIDEMNTIGGYGTPFVIPPGKTFAGWSFDDSYGTTTIDGRTPTSDEIFQPGDAYSTTGGFSMKLAYADGLNVFCDNLYIQLTSTARVIPAGDITKCELTEKLGVRRTFPATNELFFQRTRANNTIPARNGFAIR